MPSRQPDPLRELLKLVRVHDVGGHNLGPHLVAHAEALALTLRTTADDLRKAANLPDEHVVVRIRRRLDAALKERLERQARHRDEVAQRAAEELGQSARWRGECARLDVGLLLRPELTVGRSEKHVVFDGAGMFEVAVCARSLIDARHVLLAFADVRAWVDPRGLYFSWRKQRGRIRLAPRSLTRLEHREALVVPLRRASPQRESRPSRPPAHLGEVLVEMGVL